MGSGLLGWTAATATPQVEVALRHPKVRLIANALGTPPEDIIEEIHRSGRLVVALCGSAKQALSHQAAGVDVIVAQGTEGGGHTGDIGSVVLWPEVVDAVAPTPVLAAGGIGSGRHMPRARPARRPGCRAGRYRAAGGGARRAAAAARSLSRRHQPRHRPLTLLHG